MLKNIIALSLLASSLCNSLMAETYKVEFERICSDSNGEIQDKLRYDNYYPENSINIPITNFHSEQNDYLVRITSNDPKAKKEAGFEFYSLITFDNESKLNYKEIKFNYKEIKTTIDEHNGIEPLIFDYTANIDDILNKKVEIKRAKFKKLDCGFYVKMEKI